ncbi:Maf/Ham1 [Neolentinus lepideus HHB14362 ss-1]|uniref:Maf/Ham1 n=1 Tax=Neolentinus lepideus HHB14362 ss-1 TaxID=1314782 RepID=A0A165TVT7_9AGAM|nr:Maf/Ham1 [Neolentinus lepideus HHB14362 ss-1]
MPPKRSAILPHALKIPALAKLADKRVVLASNSPRRKEILQTIGIAPEIVPSTFAENLPQNSFEDVHEYPVATATHKAVEVYERLVQERPDDPPDLVIGADTVVLSHIPGPTSDFTYAQARQDILEKPESEEDNLRMLLDLNGGMCEVVTGISLVYPILSAPGYEIKSIDERTLVHFADNDKSFIQAYVSNGEGRDRAGGFAIQGLGSMLIKKIDGDYNNVVGFPCSSFVKFLQLLIDEEPDFLSI